MTSSAGATAYPFPDRPLAGRHAAVTGAGSGIGAAIADALAAAGARVSLLGRRRERLVKQRDALAARHGASAIDAVLDVTDAAAVPSALASTAALLGPIDILVNNAGAAESASFAKTDLALFERMMAVNVTGAFLCTQAALPAMLARRSGRIVNIASTAGVTGYAYVTAYCAAKHALVGLTRALAREVAESGVTVNAVCPGYTETELVDHAVSTIAEKTGMSEAAARQRLADSSPMRRLVQPGEVAAAVAFLCLPGAASVTGQAIVVAGGEVMN